MKRLSTAILLIATSSILNAGELSKNEMTNLNVCEKKDSGVAKYSKSILSSVQTLRLSGLKTIVSESGSNLKFEVGIGKEKLTVELTKMNSGELAQDNIICYEAQKVIGKNGYFSREDETLNINTMNALRIFGILDWTKQEQREDKSRRANKVAMAKLKLEEKQAIKKAKELNIKQEQNDLKEVKKLEKKDKRSQRKALRNKKKEILVIWEDFDKKYNFTEASAGNSKRKNPKNYILTDEVLDGFFDMKDKLEIKLPTINKGWRFKKFANELEKYYDKDEDKRASSAVYLDVNQMVIKVIKRKIKELKE